MNSNELLNAIAFAAHKHRDQRRKDEAASPYINHPIAVAQVLSNEGSVTDENTLIAAILHDTVEDTETSFEEIEERFGPAVAGLVRELTDDKSLAKGVRKQLQIEHAAGASLHAKEIKLADKICNLRDIVANPPTDWPLQRKREYLEWSENVVRGCRGTNAALEKLFDDVAASARKAFI